MKNLMVLAILGIALNFVPAASAGVIAVDGGWYGFCFAGPGSPATAGCQNQGVGVTGNTTSFVALGPVLLQITDAFVYGDTFEVVIDAGPSAFTSVPGSGPTTPNPDLAWTLDYSKLSVALGAGAHTVDYLRASVAA